MINDQRLKYTFLLVYYNYNYLKRNVNQTRTRYNKIGNMEFVNLIITLRKLKKYISTAVFLFSVIAF